jgi:hypothetical protein
MIRGAVVGLSLLLAACATTAPSPAKSGALIDRYDEARLKKVVGELGYAVVDADISASGKPFLSVEVGEELAFRIMGESCQGEGAAQVCQGVQLSTQFGHTGADFADLIEQGNRTLRPAKLFQVDAGMAYERYLIMDGGISEQNLAENISVFVQVMQIVLERL